MRDMICKLLIQTRIATSFRCGILCAYIEWLLYYRRCSFSALEWDVRCYWQVMAPYTHTVPFRYAICAYRHTYTCNLKTVDNKWTFCISNDCSSIGEFLVCLRVCMRDYPREHQPQTCISCSLMQYFLHILQACMYITVSCAAKHGNKTHLPYDCILHTKHLLHFHQHLIL